jgi:hypothetical protein
MATSTGGSDHTVPPYHEVTNPEKIDVLIENPEVLMGQGMALVIVPCAHTRAHIIAHGNQEKLQNLIGHGTVMVTVPCARTETHKMTRKESNK